MNVYDFTVKDIQGHDVSLSQYKDKVLLIVNTASKCGFTPQYDGLEGLYQKYKDKGLVILGFPCNQFLEQDPEDNQHIEQFCRLNHGVTFPLFAKIDVRGDQAHLCTNTLQKPHPSKATKRIKKAASSSRRSFPNTIRTMPRATASNGISPNSSSTGTAARSSALNPARHRKN